MVIVRSLICGVSSWHYLGNYDRHRASGGRRWRGSACCKSSLSLSLSLRTNTYTNTNIYTYIFFLFVSLSLFICFVGIRAATVSERKLTWTHDIYRRPRTAFNGARVYACGLRDISVMRYEPVGMRMPVVSRWLSYNQCEISLCAVRLSETNPPLKFQFSPVIAIYTARTAIFVGVLSQSYSDISIFFWEGKTDISWWRRVLILRIDGISILTKDYYQLLLSENLKISGRIGFSKTVSYIKYRDFSKSCFYWIDLAKKEYYCKEAKKRGSFRNLCVSRYDEILSRTRPYPSIRNFRILVSKPLVVIFSLETRLELHYPRNWENLILRKTFDNQIQSDQKLEIVKVCVVNRIWLLPGRSMSIIPTPSKVSVLTPRIKYAIE